MRVCRRCGATLSDRIEWCGRCGSRAAAFSPAEVLDGLTETWSPWAPPAAANEGGLRPTRRLSRLRAGATTWGGLGRVGLTAIIGGGWFVPFVLLWMTTIGPFLMIAYTVITLPGTVLILRDVWKPETIVEQPPPRSDCGTCGAPRRQGARACHVCFSAYDPTQPKTFSRTAAGVSSFGPAGRWLASMALFAAYFLGVIFVAALGPATIIVYTGAFAIVCLKVLPAIWSRARVG